MKTGFIVVTAVIGGLFAYGYPFVAILRGSVFVRTVARAWGLLFGYIIFLCLIVPGVVGLFSHKLGREMQNSWVPETTGVAAILFMGWFPPLLAALAGLVVRWLMGAFWWSALARIETFRWEKKSKPEQEGPDA